MADPDTITGIWAQRLQRPITRALTAIAFALFATIVAFDLVFTIDAQPPIVIGSSILEGDVLASGEVTYTAQFNEPLDETVIEAGDVQLLGALTGNYVPDFVLYSADPPAITLTFDDLPEDDFTLTLLSGDGHLEDLAGNTPTRVFDTDLQQRPLEPPQLAVPIPIR